MNHLVEKSTTIEIFGGTFGDDVSTLCCCLPKICVCVCNDLIPSAVWFCTELDPVKISPRSGCHYKGGRSKKKKKQHLPPLPPSLLPDEQMLISLRESERFANLSVCRATEFKGTPPWRRTAPLASAMSRLIALLVPGLSCGDGEHYWTTAPRTYMRITEPGTLRGTAQTALLTTR